MCVCVPPLLPWCSAKEGTLTIHTRAVQALELLDASPANSQAAVDDTTRALMALNAIEADAAAEFGFGGCASGQLEDCHEGLQHSLSLGKGLDDIMRTLASNAFVGQARKLVDAHDYKAAYVAGVHAPKSLQRATSHYPRTTPPRANH